MERIATAATILPYYSTLFGKVRIMKHDFKQHILKIAMASAFALGAASFGVNSYATQATGTFSVTATVTASCTVSGTTLGFGSFNALGPNVDATSAITATCTNGSAYTIGLNPGGTSGATVTTRQMVHTDTVTKLNYGLYTDVAGGTNWDDIGGTTVVSGTGNGAGQSITVYGRIPTGQTSAKAGAYSDTITATINY